MRYQPRLIRAWCIGVGATLGAVAMGWVPLTAFLTAGAFHDLRMLALLVLACGSLVLGGLALATAALGRPRLSVTESGVRLDSLLGARWVAWPSLGGFQVDGQPGRPGSSNGAGGARAHHRHQCQPEPARQAAVHDSRRVPDADRHAGRRDQCAPSEPAGTRCGLAPGRRAVRRGQPRRHQGIHHAMADLCPARRPRCHVRAGAEIRHRPARPSAAAQPRDAAGAGRREPGGRADAWRVVPAVHGAAAACQPVPPDRQRHRAVHGRLRAGKPGRAGVADGAVRHRRAGRRGDVDHGQSAPRCPVSGHRVPSWPCSRPA